MENKELLEKAKQAGSPEELLALAKENDYPLDEEEARALFGRFGKSGELSDEELDNVAGGCGDGDIEKINTGYKCADCNCMIRITRNKKTGEGTRYCGCGSRPC